MHVFHNIVRVVMPWMQVLINCYILYITVNLGLKYCYLFYGTENHLKSSLNNLIWVLHEEITFIPYNFVF